MVVVKSPIDGTRHGSGLVVSGDDDGGDVNFCPLIDLASVVGFYSGVVAVVVMLALILGGDGGDFVHCLTF